MHYARCYTCRSELVRRDAKSDWKHIHRIPNDHIPQPDRSSILNVARKENVSKR